MYFGQSFLRRFSWLVFSATLVAVMVWGSAAARTGAAVQWRAAAGVAVAQVSPEDVSGRDVFGAEVSEVFLGTQAESGEFVLPPLAYGYDALAPYVDEQTMRLHHDKHHAGYVKNLNGAIADYPELKGQSLASLLLNLEAVPEAIRGTVRNNGGGHANHSMFWETMKPSGTANGQAVPNGVVAQAITESFGDFSTFQEAFNTAGKQRFGSGWAWLVMTADGKLAVMSTANQDNPLSSGLYPLMGNDVWEHAYYLTYQNRRSDYLDAWWNLIDWDVINRRYEQALAVLDKTAL
ncbi:MAG: superoxide dismutase [Cyanobacteria bacterium J06597_16]